MSVSKKIILSKIVEYLLKQNIKFRNKVANVKSLYCPVCNDSKCIATIIPVANLLRCAKEKKKYSLIDLVKILEEDKKDLSEEDILQYLKKELEINVITEKDEKEIEDLLSFYKENNFSLIPITKNSKVPAIKEWTNKIYTEIEDWRNWVSNSLNLGSRTGKVSGITVIDIDVLLNDEKEEFRFKNISKERATEILNKRKDGLKTIDEEIGKIIGNPLVLKNLGGKQLIYQYEEDIPKTKLDIKDIHIDIENDGGYILIPPSKLGKTNRKFEALINPPKMPKELKKILLDKVTVPRKTNSEKIAEDISTGDFNLGLIKEGERSDNLCRIGGLLRKELNINQTRHSLNIINRHLCERPLPNREINAMLSSLDRYIQDDNQELAHKVLSYLKDAKQASKAEIEICVFGERVKGEKRKVVDKLLVYLIKEGKIMKKGKEYQILERMQWNDELLNVGTPVDFEVPYLGEIANFNKSDLIIIGSQNKYGKTHLSLNFIQRLVKQGIKPYYIYNESGCRFSRIALNLGLKDGDFYHVFCSDPEKIILENNAITIFDWVKPTDFTRVDNLFNGFVEKLEKSKGLMVSFVQLKNDDTFFAPNQIGQFPAMLCRYLYEDETGKHTKFKIDNVREAKVHGKVFEVPTQYIPETKEVKTIKELEKGDK